MSEILKNKGDRIALVICIVFFLGMMVVTKLDRDRVRYADGVNHIRIVVLTDKNCNDCHLGASFVNLFNHPAVKGNDNTVLLMMDKAKIKRW